MFPITRWTLIQQVNDETRSDSRLALEELCQQYAQPVLAFVQRRVSSLQEAEDVTQEFFAQLINGRLLSRADPNRGTFRAFLLNAVRNFIADSKDRQNAVKRGGQVNHVSLEPTGQVDAGEVTAEQAFELQWVRSTLSAALLELEQEYRESDKADIFEALKGALDESAQVTAREAGRTLKMTESAVRVCLHRMRKRLGQLIRRHIQNTVEKAEQVDDEIRNLMQLLEANR